MSEDQGGEVGRRAADDPKPTKSKKGLIVVIASLIALALIGGGAFWFTQRKDTVAQPTTATHTPAELPPSDSPAPDTPEATPTPGTPTPGTPTPDPNKCTTATEGFKPTELQIEDLGVTSHMMSVAYDENGDPGSPPLDDLQGTAWFNGSPAPGSPEGVTMLTIHTYRHGGALGNQLLDELENGTTLKVTDGNGKVACYDVYDELKVWVNEYDPEGPEATRLHAKDGEPNVAIVVCDDFNWDREDWDSRVIWYAKLV